MVYWLGLLDFSKMVWANAKTGSHFVDDASTWEIWKERDARVFCNTSTPTTVVVRKIKEEAHL